jgi:SP family sugar:H+ symporter-like MFS transporter
MNQIASFASTWGPAAWVIIGEIFPLRTRENKLPLLQRSIGLETVRLGYVPGQLMLTTEDSYSRVIVMIAFLTPFADSGIGFAFGYVL